MDKLNIIGGSGFIGSNLVLNLMRRTKVGPPFLILDKVINERFSAISKRVDVREIEGLRTNISIGGTIINLAAEHRDDVRPLKLYEDVNVDGARNICKIANEKDIKKIIFTSSVAVYGLGHLECCEDFPPNPLGPYGRTKLAAEKIFSDWQREKPDERIVVIIRPTVVFGEGNRGNVYNLMRQIASGKFLMIGDGKNRKSLAYVQNLVGFIEHIIDCKLSPGVHIFNYADKPDYDMQTLVGIIRRECHQDRFSTLKVPRWTAYGVGLFFDLISAISKRSFGISLVRVKKFCEPSVYSSRVRLTGYVPKFSLREGLSSTIRADVYKDGHS